MNFLNRLKSYFGFDEHDANIKQSDYGLDELKETVVETPTKDDEQTSVKIDDAVIVEQPVAAKDNVVDQRIFNILEEDEAAKDASDGDEVGVAVPVYKGPERWGCTCCCTDLNRPWPPMWAPQIQNQQDEIGDSDEELDMEMIALTKPDAVLSEDKSGFFVSIWKCFTTVRSFKY